MTEEIQPTRQHNAERPTPIQQRRESIYSGLETEAQTLIGYKQSIDQISPDSPVNEVIAQLSQAYTDVISLYPDDVIQDLSKRQELIGKMGQGIGSDDTEPEEVDIDEEVRIANEIGNLSNKPHILFLTEFSKIAHSLEAKAKRSRI